MKPKPWSFSALDGFVNCPKQYNETKNLKRFKDDKTPEILWGEYVHKCFEDRQRDGVVLPVDLHQHEEYMTTLQLMPGKRLIETKIALNRRMEPCGFFDKDVWYRGVVDWGTVDGETAHMVDFKTGKPHSKFKQLKTFALHTFAAHPKVEQVISSFYWTKTQSVTNQVYHRSQITELWVEFVPDLKQYVEAFKTNTWQARPSGLCGWCPVTDCDHWRPRPRGR